MNYNVKFSTSLQHHGVQGQQWGVQHGPPYPLDSKISTGSRLKMSRQQRKLEKIKEKQALEKEKTKLQRLRLSEKTKRTNKEIEGLETAAKLKMTKYKTKHAERFAEAEIREKEISTEERTKNAQANLDRASAEKYREIFKSIQKGLETSGKYIDLATAIVNFLTVTSSKTSKSSKNKDKQNKDKQNQDQSQSKEITEIVNKISNNSTSNVKVSDAAANILKETFDLTDLNKKGFVK